MAEEDEEKFRENGAQEKAQVVENAGREGLPKAGNTAEAARVADCNEGAREAESNEDVREVAAKGGEIESASEGDEMKTAQLSEAEESAPEKKTPKIYRKANFARRFDFGGCG